MALRIVIAWLAIVAVGCAGPATPSALSSAAGSSSEAVGSATPSTSATIQPAPDATPKPTPRPSPVAVPPKPSGVGFHEHAREDDDGHFAYISQRVTWKAPRTKGVEVKVYGVTRCLAEPVPLPTEEGGGPCLVKGTKLPASVRTLLATAPASDGVARWRWREESGCNPGLEYDDAGPVIYAIVLAAYNEAGHSTFAIAEPGGWQVYGPNDIVC